LIDSFRIRLDSAMTEYSKTGRACGGSKAKVSPMIAFSKQNC
jgi:hypothetical protein